MTEHLPHQEVGETNAQSATSSLGYPKILVAVDYLNTTPEIFEQAIHLAKTLDSQLMVFCCLQGGMPGATDLTTIYAGMAGYGGVYSHEMVAMEEILVEETTEELKAWLGGLVQYAIQADLKAIGDYSYGEPGRQICAKAKEWGANLIIVGRRGRTGLSELLLGSVSNYVIHHASCCVLVVQH